MKVERTRYGAINFYNGRNVVGWLIKLRSSGLYTVYIPFAEPNVEIRRIL